MVDYIVWGMADPLTVEQAAWLWAGIDPSSSLLLKQLPAERAAIAPRLQMLTGAIASGELRANTEINPLHKIGDHSKSLVKRVDLMALAESRGERPAFLFDTMLKSVAEAPKSDPAPHQKNKGGRPSEWDWNSFTLEIIRIANSPDGLPETRAGLAEIMRDWFIGQCDSHPADTTLEDRIRLIYQYIEQHRKPASR
jgi:hypothetical protein